MTRATRRRLLTALGAATLGSSATTRLALAAMTPDDKFDLVIKGGEVLDPSQNLRAQRDIGVRYGRIEALQADIPAARGERVLNASGRTVLPGLIDLHSHVYPYGSSIGIPADELIPYQGTTTMVSAGDAGSNNFAGFRRYTMAQSRTRLFAFVHIASQGLAGFPVGELLNIDFARPGAAARVIGENADIVLGVKVRMSENVIAEHGIEALQRAILACEMSGTRAKVMCHIGGVQSVALMSEILDTLRPDDILTHCYSGAPNLKKQFTNIVQHGKLLPAALEAKKRGVVFDVGHGGGSFDFTVARAAIDQGCPPDVISSDIHVFSANSPGEPYLPNVMSKFVSLGFSVEEVVTMATANPARVIDRVAGLGSLQIGAPADASIVDLVSGPVEWVDTRNNTMTGTLRIKPVTTVLGGVVFGRPYQAPFAVR